MQHKKWTYEEFPEFTEIPEGAKAIDSTGEEILVEYFPNVEYTVADGTHLTLQLLVPTTRNEKNHPEKQKLYPCVVHIQGSAWMEQDMYKALPNRMRLAERGYVVVNVQYRHSGIASFPSQARDGMEAIRFLKKYAQEYHIDPEKMIVSGDSSGGHTAVFTQILSCKGNDMESRVKGIIDLYGSVSVMDEDSNPTTMSHHLPNSPEGRVLGGADMIAHPELRKILSAEENITADMDLPPVLIFHGTKDRTVNTRQNVHLYDKLKALDKDVQFYLVKGADHGGAEFWTDAALDIMQKFIAKCTE